VRVFSAVGWSSCPLFDPAPKTQIKMTKAPGDRAQGSCHWMAREPCRCPNQEQHAALYSNPTIDAIAKECLDTHWAPVKGATDRP
jgi:hypothetical protein